MRSSTWSALGNTYVVVEPDPARSLNPAQARDLAGDADGVVEVVSAGDEDMRIVIWNPDGSQAELSGNGTRIAAAWLAERTGARRISVRVGEREVVATVLESGEIEQDLGEVRVGSPEVVDGIALVPVSVGNPHAVVVGDPVRDPTHRPPARDASPVPRPHQRSGCSDRRSGRGYGARLGARSRGDVVVRNERRRGRGSDPRCWRRCRALSRRRPSRATRGRPRAPHRARGARSLDH